MDKQMAKSRITSTSIITVTLIAVLVYRPFARISLIMAIADDGDRATKIVPVRIAIASILLCDKLAINGM